MIWKLSTWIRTNLTDCGLKMCLLHLKLYFSLRWTMGVFLLYWDCVYFLFNGNDDEKDMVWCGLIWLVTASGIWFNEANFRFQKHFICEKRLFLSRRITWKSFDKSGYALLHNIRNRIVYLCPFTEGVKCAVGLFKPSNLELSMASADWTLWKRIDAYHHIKISEYRNIDESAYWHSNVD